MFDKLKFKAKVIEKGMTLADVAKKIGINESTLYRKVNGESEFSRSEIQSLCDILSIESPVEIFFAQ